MDSQDVFAPYPFTILESKYFMPLEVSQGTGYFQTLLRHRDEGHGRTLAGGAFDIHQGRTVFLLDDVDFIEVVHAAADRAAGVYFDPLRAATLLVIAEIAVEIVIDCAHVLYWVMGYPSPIVIPSNAEGSL